MNKETHKPPQNSTHFFTQERYHNSAVSLKLYYQETFLNKCWQSTIKRIGMILFQISVWYITFCFLGALAKNNLVSLPKFPKYISDSKSNNLILHPSSATKLLWIQTTQWHMPIIYSSGWRIMQKLCKDHSLPHSSFSIGHEVTTTPVWRATPLTTCIPQSVNVSALLSNWNSDP